VTYWRLFYHIVWGTKNRSPQLDDERGKLLRQAFVEVAGERETLIHAIGWMPDHVHLAVSIPPKVAVSDVVQRLKGVSSHRVNQSGGDAFKWQQDYGIVSFSESKLPTVVAYIQNQRAHHADNTLIAALEHVRQPESLSNRIEHHP
jgi:REP element-mobilizing transposase RayT